MSHFKASIYNYYFIYLNEYYVYNTRSGCLGKLTKDEYRFLTQEEFQELYSIEALDSFFEQGLIVNKDLNEFNELIYKEMRALLNNSPYLTFVIAPTLNCNLRCFYCFQQKHENIVQLPYFCEDVFHFIVKQIKKQSARQISVKWFGGEPLLAIDTIIELSNKLIKYCKENNIKYISRITTNGVLLNEDTIEILVNNCSIKQFQITLDGTEKTYLLSKKATIQQYNQVLENIATVSKHAKIDVRFNCTENNFDDILLAFSNLWKKQKNNLNLSNIFFYIGKVTNYLENDDKIIYATQEQFDLFQIQFERFLKNFGINDKRKPPAVRRRGTYCGLRKANSFIIGPNGDLYKCEHDIGFAVYRVGNINTGYWYNDCLIKWVKTQHDDRCATCNLFPLCLGGCSANQRLLGNNSDCAITLKLLESRLIDFLKNT